MNKTINFGDLGRNEVRCLIYRNEEGVVVAEYSQSKIKELQKKIENPILVFNPDSKLELKLQEIISKAGEGVYKDNKDITISATSLIVDFIPLVSNIILNLDVEKDIEQIEAIIKDPSEEFELIVGEVGKIVERITRNYEKTVNAFVKLPKSEQEKILKNAEPKVAETEEERQLRELEEQLTAMKEKLNNKNKVIDITETVQNVEE